jgi:hypothetical protein
MPVQINEMVIRANIVEPASKDQKPSEGNSGKDEIIRECTEIILEILRNTHER